MYRLQKTLLPLGIIATIVIVPIYINPFTPHPFDPQKSLIFCGFTVVLSLFTLAAALSGKQRFSVNLKSDTLRATMFYIFAIGIATAFSIEPAKSIWGIGDRHGVFLQIAGVLFFLLVALLLGEQMLSIDTIFTALITTSVPITIYGLVQWFGLDPLIWSGGGISPVFSTLGRTVHLGAYLAILAPVSLYFVYSVRGQKASIYILLLSQIMLVFATLARGAFVALASGLAIFAIGIVFHTWSYKKLWTLAIGVILLTSALLSLIWLKGDIFVSVDNGNKTSIAEVRAINTSMRLQTWRKLGPVIEESWLFGYGPETFAEAYVRHYPFVKPPDHYQVAWISDPHNVFLYQLLSYGIVGFVPFVVLLGQALWINFKSVFMRPETEELPIIQLTLLSSLCAYLVHAQFNPDVVPVKMLYWLLIGLSLGQAFMKTGDITLNAN